MTSKQQNQDQSAHNDSVPTKGLEAIFCKERDEKLDGENGNYKCYDTAYQQHAYVIAQSSAVLLFEKHLQQYINKKGLKNSEVYATANISKQYFSKLLKGQVKPSKEKVLALAVGLHLNLDETVDFLRLAGYALSPISQTDVIVEYFIKYEDYSVMKIDIVLFDYGLDPLSKG